MQDYKNLSNVWQRVIFGILGAVIIVSGICFDAYSYFILFLCITVLGLTEFYGLLRLNQDSPLRWLGTIYGAFIFTLSFFISSGQLPPRYYISIFPVLSTIYFVKLYKKKDLKPFTNIGFTFLGILYVALPFSLMNVAAYGNGGYYNWQVIMGCYLLLWASDTGAYFAGRQFGKTKLFLRVSPKKSWEGSIGGATASIVSAVIIAHYFTSLELLNWVILAIIIVVAGTYGDLVESLFKRSISIKDSGSTIPGHGGFLDRFDGMLLAAPFIAAYLLLFN